jgi:SAM-dependent methyltransferase
VTDRPPIEVPSSQSIAYFSSDAYVLDVESEVEQVTAAWLEEQAGMPFIREVAARTFELMELRPGDAVLDVGCGTGVMLPALAEAVGPDGSVTALDRSPAFLARAAKRLRDGGLDDRVTLVQGDALGLPFPDGTFRVTHAERVLMHLADPDAALREMTRVTRPGGRVVCSEVFANGVELDYPDRDLTELVGRAISAGQRNPSMGIELRRRMVTVGLETVTTVAVADVETRMHDDEIDEYRRRGAELAEQGLVDRERVGKLVSYLVEANEAGTHTGLSVIFVAAGTVTAAGPRA